MRHEPERTESVVDRHQDDIPTRELSAVIAWLMTGALRESTTVNPNHDRKLGFVLFSRRPNIQIQAVFALPTLLPILFLK